MNTRGRFSALAVSLLSAGAAEAYVGPGAGFALLGSFFGLLVAILAGALSLLIWPFRWVIRAWRRRKALAAARVRRVIVIGLDGLDPGLAERWVAEGELPNLARLAAQGSFSRLRTTYPSISPVAWSSFMTGVDPSRHNIYDFLDRDLRTYQPKLSSSEVSATQRTMRVGQWIVPLGQPLVRNMRRSRAFWSILGDHGIACNILRVPLTFPPEKFAGAMLSAMCVPDLRGTQGSFTYYTTDPAEAGATSTAPEATGGMRVLLTPADGGISATLPGPDNPLREDRRPVELPFTLRPQVADGTAELGIGGRRHRLKLREYSPWIRLAWQAAPGVKVHGIARFYITRLEPHIGLYVTPINIDPGNPALPISWPTYYSVYLSKLIGDFATLGLAEDTWALNERVIDEQAFFQQTMDHHEEREKMFLNALRKSREGVVACVFDGTDRAQHMFYRYLEPDHPANRGKDTEVYRHAIRDVYKRADRTIGLALDDLRPDDLLLVVSDHGFQSFRRGVNLNAWLQQQGLLALKDPAAPCGDWFDNVDWTRTQAYAFGLGGIYVNLAGREAHGIVAPADAPAVRQRIVAGLAGLRDPQTGSVAISAVYEAAAVHTGGPYQAAGLDLIVGYDRGYRASWESATGRVTREVFSDNTKSWSGDHCVDPRLVPGVLYSSRPVRAEDPGIMDLAPTILRLFGVAVPAHMTGKPLAIDV
ncbi:MAG: nucleotide pyrophosphatase [Gammaproteobacteria bacterium]|nr:nucleotide pyrophosphatase [Gammaproteobacteria bacterium]